MLDSVGTSPFYAPVSASVERWGLPPTPRKVEISITARCNLACSFCYYAGDMKRGEDLPTGTWLSFFDELARCRVLHVTLLGGEPFARHDILDLIDAIVERRMRFCVLSNGTLIDRDVAERLARTGRADYVQVSLDGDRPTHDRLRGPGSFDRAVAGIRHLQDQGVPVTVRFTITREAASKVYDTCSFIRSLGIGSFGINEVFPRGRACDQREELLLDTEAKLEAMRQMERFHSEHPGVVQDQGGGPLWRLKFKDALRQHREQGTPLPFKAGYLSSCRCAFSKIEVLHDGTYVPCNQLSGMVLGNIRTDSLADLWQNHPTMQELRDRTELSLREVPGCRDCEFVDLCAGGCPAMVEGIEQNMAQPNPLECFLRIREIIDAFEFSQPEETGP